MSQNTVNKKTIDAVLSDFDTAEAEVLLEKELEKGEEANVQLVEALVNFLSGSYVEIDEKDRVECLTEAERIIKKENSTGTLKKRITAFISVAAAVLIICFFIFPEETGKTGTAVKSMLFGEEAEIKLVHSTEKQTENAESYVNTEKYLTETEADVTQKESTETVSGTTTNETYYENQNNSKLCFTSLVCENRDTVFSSFDAIDYSSLKIYGVYYNTVLEKECYREIPFEDCNFSLVYRDDELGRATVKVSFEDLTLSFRIFYKTENSPVLSSIYADDKGLTFSPETATVYAIYSDGTKKKIPFGDYSYTHSTEEKDGIIYNLYCLTYIEDEICVNTTLSYETHLPKETEAIK